MTAEISLFSFYVEILSAMAQLWRPSVDCPRTAGMTDYLICVTPMLLFYTAHGCRSGKVRIFIN